MERIVPLILSENEVEEVAPPLEEIISIVEKTFQMEGQGQVEVPPKIGVHPDCPRSFLHAMPAWVAGVRALGMKWISYFPGNVDNGRPDSSGIIILNHPEHGLPVAIMAGMWITYARTSACAAVAAKYLATAKPTRLGLVGCGRLGRWSLRALSIVFPTISEVKVADLSPASRENFCAEMAGKGAWKLLPVDNTEEAVAGMDIVISSTSQPAEPPIKGEWWEPRTLAIPLDVLSGWDDRAFGEVENLVTDNYESLTMRKPKGRPGFKLPEKWSTLADVVTGKAPGRESLHERIMALLSGVASTDMTVGWEIYRRAIQMNRGIKVALT